MKKTGKKQKNKGQKKKLNRQIVFITILFSALFVYMSYYIADYSLKNRTELISNSYNGRAKILAAQNMRGTIYSNDKTVLVSSSVNEDGNEVRNYNYGNMFAHIVGYATNGRMGVESYANYYLINSNAPVSVKASMDAKGEKYPGDSVFTTLDVDIQKTAYEAMGMYQGAIIVTEPSTGKILALVSKPDFDPAQIQYTWDELINHTGSSILLNRVTQGSYPPGSTFKIITALEYIRENPTSFNNYSYNCVGQIKHGEDVIRCYHGSVHGLVDFDKSFAKSCNSSFANIGLTLNRDEFGKTLDNLLFNKELPTSLSASTNKLVVDANTDDSDMIQVSIGQGKANISPLQLNMITCAIANNGVLMEPYVIDRVENQQGTLIKDFKEVKYGSLMTEDEAGILQDLMVDVVENGTATRLKGQSYYAAGKTGSAEYGTIKGESHAWFTGFAGREVEGIRNPADISVTIIIEGAGTGGDYAVPIAKRIFDTYYDKLANAKAISSSDSTEENDS